LKISELTKGIIAAFSASLSMIIFIILFLSQGNIEDSFILLFKQNKLGGLISIGALVNLPLFFLGLRKRREDFARGVLIASLIIVITIALLKII
jgi:hypothetical protein